MISEPGTIIQLDSASALVSVSPASSCSGCSQKSGCGTSLMARWLNPVDQIRVPLDPQLVSQLEIGDVVELSVEEGAFVRSALLVFVVPLLALVLFAWIGQQFGSDLIALIAAGCGLALSVVLVRWVQQKFRYSLMGTPVLRPMLKNVKGAAPSELESAARVKFQG